MTSQNSEALHAVILDLLTCTEDGWLLSVRGVTCINKLNSQCLNTALCADSTSLEVHFICSPRQKKSLGTSGPSFTLFKTNWNFFIDFNRLWISALVQHKWQTEEKLRLNGLKVHCLCLFFFANEQVLMNFTQSHYGNVNS